MYATTYCRPRSLAEASALFSAREDAAYLSGGHTLLPAMKSRLAAPAHLIDLRHIPDLNGLSVGPETIAIGAATVHADVANAPDVKRILPVLAGLAGSIGDVHVRHAGTIGGSLANNDPAADYPSAVLALKGVVHTDRRQLPAEVFFAGLYATALEEGEIVTRIELAVPEIAAYAKFRNPASRYAMAATFLARHRDGSVRVAVTGAGNSGVFRWSAAEEALSAAFSPDALHDLEVDPADMMSDMHGSAEYRAHLVKLMTRRAVANPGRVLVSP